MQGKSRALSEEILAQVADGRWHIALLAPTAANCGQLWLRGLRGPLRRNGTDPCSIRVFVA